MPMRQRPRRDGGSSPAGQERAPARRRLGVGGKALAGGAGLVAIGVAFRVPAALAQPFAGVLEASDVMQFSLFAGVTAAAFITAFMLIRERGRIARENVELKARLADAAGALRRSETLLNLRDQRFVVWSDNAARPELVGSLPPDAGAPEDRATFLAFGKWLTPESAGALDRAVARLRDKGTPFELAVETLNGTVLETQGRHTVSHRALRIASVSGMQREFADLRLDHQRLSREHEHFVNLLDAVPMPAWLRSPAGRLEWVNAAYAKSVDAGSAETAAREGRELIGEAARETIARHHLARDVFANSVSVVVEGDRRIFAVTDVSGAEGSAGIACDTTEVELIREEYQRTIISHADTLDQLNTAVAIFDSEQKLLFYNQAFQALWELDAAFLESEPDHTLVLDRLRSDGKLAEQPEWRRWKEQLLGAYRSVDPVEDWWHLPDGRTIRVVATPQPKGGVTWVFENLTEKFTLESRYNTAVRVQGETLDNLAEGVAVFGPDGKVRLANPAFSGLWSLPDGLVKPDTHISLIRAACAEHCAESPWPLLVSLVTGFDEERRDRSGQIEMRDGTVLRYAVIHLPNGQVMTTFVDITDSVNVQRALSEKNEALEKADQLKNEFVQHVSYELRSPLTNIIGFTELLGLDQTGPLNERQREYVGHIGSSSAVLLTIVNDILDLATVDAGIMQLDIADVSVRRAVDSAAELIAERLREHDIGLKIDIAAAPDTVLADEHRLRQILFNLLSNAANYAPEGSTVRLECRRADGGGVEFLVHDDGPGMSDEVLETIFRRFEPQSNGGRRRGAGLGLSIVKSFVELHGGEVAIETGEASGTSVICRLPETPKTMRAAAE